MIRTTVRSVFQLVAATGIMVLLAVSAVAWRLNQGPISLDFLTPILETALTQGEFSVSLDQTVLTLGQDDRLLDIRVLNVNAYRAGTDLPLASVPEMSLSLSVRALLNGQIAPKTAILYKPRLRLVRDEEDHLLWSMGGDGAAAADPANQSRPAASEPTARPVEEILSALLGEPGPGQPARHMNRAAIVDADIQVIDRKTGRQWRIPSADVDIRRVIKGLLARVRLNVDLDGQAGSLQGRASFDKNAQSYDAELIFSGLRPASLVPLHSRLHILQAADFPLSGQIRLRGDLKDGLDGGEFDISAAGGLLTLPAPLNWQRRIDALHLRGQLSRRLTEGSIDELTLEAGGAHVRLSAKAEGLGKDGRITLHAGAQHVSFDELPSLWPPFVAPNARDWVVANLSRGMVHEAKANVSLRLTGFDANTLVVEQVSGDMQGDGAVVNYLRPMPAVRNGVASASFDANEFRIHIKRGEVYGLNVHGGTIILGGLSAPDQFADIDLDIVGPVSDALKLIDNKPLRYAQALGIDPLTVGGQAGANLKLKFPLLKNLRLDDVQVKATANIRDITLPKVALGQDITGGELALEVDARGLDASGPVILGTIPADLKWRENFSVKNTPFRSRYQLQAKAVDEEQRKALGLDGPPFVAPFLTGPVGAEVEVRLYGGGKGDIEAKVDLSPAYMSLPGLDWRKETRTTGHASVAVRLEKLKLDSIPRFEVMAGDLVTRGSVDFDEDGHARKVHFSRLAYGGRTDVRGSLALRPGGGLDIIAEGSSFNAEPVVARGEENIHEAEQRLTRRHRKDDLPPMSVQMNVGQMWLSRDGRLKDAAITLHRDQDNWHSLSLKGRMGAAGWLEARMQPGPDRTRAVRVTSNDAGAMLRAFDTYEHMVGGDLEIEAAYDDKKDDQPLAGTVTVRDYHIVNAPALARLLTVAALTGIVDVLRGQGVGFSNLDAPFVLSDGLLKIRSARAWGAALGLTASGEVDLDRSRMALEGTVVPAYAINSMLGNLPLIGWLVTGGEKGGGLVAFNFSMRGSTQEPDVLVNPLSALTPGFLRNLFNIFDSGAETEARKRPAEGSDRPQAPAGEPLTAP